MTSFSSHRFLTRLCLEQGCRRSLDRHPESVSGHISAQRPIILSNSFSRAVLFALFTLGMSGSSLQFILLNSTTIENLSRRHKVWFLAIHIPRLSAPVTATTVRFSTISYPLAVASSSVPMQGPTKYFAILHSKPGDNPFDLGFFKNFKSVMGEHWYDWFLPLRHSPCCNHDQKESQFSLGDVVKRMREDAGLSSPRGSIQEIRRSKRRKHQPKKSKQGTQPDFSDSPSETERRRVREKKDEQKSEERSGLNSEINHGDLR